MKFTPIIFFVFVWCVLNCHGAEVDVENEARFDLTKTPQITCGSINKCDSSAFFHQSSVRNQRCVWVYSIKGAVKYEIAYQRYVAQDDKRTVGSIIAPDSGIFISAFFAEKIDIDNHVLKTNARFTVEGNTLLFTFWTNHFFTDDSVIHFIDVKAIRSQRQISPAAIYSNYALFTPNMEHFRHPPKGEEIFENVDQYDELSLYVMLPPSNIVGFPLEETTMKITLKRVSHATGIPQCELQRVDFRTLNISDARNPDWTLRNEICDDKPIASLTFFDVGIIVVHSMREQRDIRRAFEVFYTL